MRRSLVIILIMLALMLSACAKPATPAKDGADAKDPEQQGAPQSHSITKADERELMKVTRENLDIIMSVRDDTSPLEKALSGLALEEMSAQVEDAKANGRIKVRNYSGIKLELQNITANVAGLKLTFKDKSYVVGAETSETIEEASGARIELLLATKRVKKRWRIIEIFSEELKPGSSPKKQSTAS